MLIRGKLEEAEEMYVRARCTAMRMFLGPDLVSAYVPALSTISEKAFQVLFLDMPGVKGKG